ncbi:ABC-2 type transport system ATP-binding protein [Micromonospora violae]|uniref:ABC-2 type transport system ATP-binding protein n=1 Tax=Micromonospora violae TaxID=1278207 RepID=A0A4Q7UDN4_9ACTN|nr:ABC transporter ATP-binding protein [Micromonospora violae]RZT79357.1 ABC-2 type transport system ATP-binding protein [Micromonospora violae]
MTSALITDGLTKRYGRRPALKDCTLDIPAGHVVGLVGPNGAGKSTLLQLACGLLRPTAGQIEVLGVRPVSGSPRVGFVAQDTPVYAGLTVADHLRMGAHLNPSWDGALAQRRIAQVGVDPAQKAGKLSGGQRAQLALTIAAAKRPNLLLLDEPVAALDPLARRTFLRGLMELAAEQGMSIVMSSHLVADLERICDHLIVLVASQVRVAGDVDDLLATHHRLVGQRRDTADLGAGRTLVEQSHTEVQSTLVVRSTAPIVDPSWQVDRLDLEDIVLAYMSGATGDGPDRVLEGQR